MSQLKSKIINLLIKRKSLTPLQMAQYAKDSTAFYRRLYCNYAMDNFENLPIFSKYDLSDVSPYDFLSEKYKEKAFLYGETSGSSGSPTPSFFTKKEFEGLLMLSSLSPYMEDVKKKAESNRTAVNGLSFGFTIAGFAFGALLQKQGALVAQLGSRSTIAMPERTAKTIAKLKPFLISATPLDFMTWMEIIRSDCPKEYTTVMDNLRFLMSTAEPCAISRQNQIEKHFNIKHINTYASVDGLVAIPCPCGEKHLIENLLHIELYDKNKKYIGQKGKGRLCFTHLIKRSAPMVKFLVDDFVTIKNSDCPYGFKTSIEPHGRYELTVNLNKKIWGGIDFEEIIYKYGLFMDYRVDIFDSEIKIELEEYPQAKKDYNVKNLKKEFEARTGLTCEVKLVPLESLTNLRSVRSTKSIVKVLDKRKISRQDIPVYI